MKNKIAVDFSINQEKRTFTIPVTPEEYSKYKKARGSQRISFALNLTSLKISRIVDDRKIIF
ncbi:hypothetical protein CSB07_01555 [Candidatus Gracilibacteria bacterium]|nr:MAG: hypothetical protein CSB07_01555 [Candidatus Gracilibacteria bacterium]PIE85034.1 MAG: hypothetical protein CSA08_03785 [Candidatus Gracilibacteria bacterium]